MNKFKQRALDLPRAAKRLLALTVDVIFCVLAAVGAFYLRFDYWELSQMIVWPIAASIIIAIPLFVRAGLYRAVFRYSGRGALVALSGAGAIYALIYAMIFTFVRVGSVPRSIGLIQPLLLIAMVAISRIVVRLFLAPDYLNVLATAGKRANVLIYGAGQAGRQLAAALRSSPDMRVIGYVDDDPALRNNLLNGRPIFGPDKLAQIIADEKIRHVLLAMPSATRARRAAILEILKPTGVMVRTLPGLNDIAHGRISVGDLRELDIEDLLGRKPVEPNPELLVKSITGKVVLVTGAGGSIASEICRKALALSPSVLLLYEISEPALYEIHQDLSSRDAALGVTIIPVLGSVTDRHRMDRVFAEWRVDTVYHAAAYKHVPLIEANASQGVINNAFGTITAAQAAHSAGVSDFVLISTDKAVRPTSVMGATKRLAEQVLQALSAERSVTTRFAMVRFGNVLGSSGSVVPLFRKQIREGGPVTVTDEEMTRYFMSIPEAAELVIQAGSMAQGGEVFILDMGSPVRITDLARNMIELSGLRVRDSSRPDGDIAIKIVGLRPGEKLYEELLISENDTPTAHPRILKAHEPFLPWVDLEPEMARLRQLADAGKEEAVLERLRLLVPEFRPEGEREKAKVQVSVASSENCEPTS